MLFQNIERATGREVFIVRLLPGKIAAHVARAGSDSRVCHRRYGPEARGGEFAKAGENGPEPTHFREEFRTRGPSNYAHGKQADYLNV